MNNEVFSGEIITMFEVFFLLKKSRGGGGGANEGGQMKQTYRILVTIEDG